MCTKFQTVGHYRYDTFQEQCRSRRIYSVLRWWRVKSTRGGGGDTKGSTSILQNQNIETPSMLDSRDDQHCRIYHGEKAVDDRAGDALPPGGKAVPSFLRACECSGGLVNYERNYEKRDAVDRGMNSPTFLRKWKRRGGPRRADHGSCISH